MEGFDVGLKILIQLLRSLQGLAFEENFLLLRGFAGLIALDRIQLVYIHEVPPRQIEHYLHVGYLLIVDDHRHDLVDEVRLLLVWECPVEAFFHHCDLFVVGLLGEEVLFWWLGAFAVEARRVFFALLSTDQCLQASLLGFPVS